MGFPGLKLALAAARFGNGRIPSLINQFPRAAISRVRTLASSVVVQPHLKIRSSTDIELLRLFAQKDVQESHRK
jgi:hypothetical protein